MSTEVDYSLLHDWGVLMPVLQKELNQEALNLIETGVSPHKISKVFANVRDKVVAKINRLAVSMDGFDITVVLSRFYATQLSTKLFKSSRRHIANIVVAAVYASGYEYEGAGPYENNMDDFEDGFNLIGVKKVSGGCVDDSFSVEGICITFKPHANGSEKLDVVYNPVIMILKPDRNSQIKDMSGEVKLSDILKNSLERGPNVVLTSQAIDGDSKKELAKQGIYFAELVSVDDLNRLAEATCAERISYNHNNPKKIQKHIGTCKSFQQKIFGNEVFGIFSGCPRGNVATIVLYGDDQFIEEKRMYEAELYVRDLIPEVRSVMNEYKLVEGGRDLFHKIIEYVHEEANNADIDSKPIINAFAKAIKAVSDKTYDNVGCNPSQKHPIAPGVGNALLEPPSVNLWEPPSVKFNTIYGAARVVCYQLSKKLK